MACCDSCERGGPCEGCEPGQCKGGSCGLGSRGGNPKDNYGVWSSGDMGSNGYGESGCPDGYIAIPETGECLASGERSQRAKLQPGHVFTDQDGNELGHVNDDGSVEVYAPDEYAGSPDYAPGGEQDYCWTDDQGKEWCEPPPPSAAPGGEPGAEECTDNGDGTYTCCTDNGDGTSTCCDYDIETDEQISECVDVDNQGLSAGPPSQFPTPGVPGALPFIPAPVDPFGPSAVGPYGPGTTSPPPVIVPPWLRPPTIAKPPRAHRRPTTRPPSGTGPGLVGPRLVAPRRPGSPAPSTRARPRTVRPQTRAPQIIRGELGGFMNLDHVRSIRGDRGEVFSPGDLELLHQGPSNLGGDWGGGQSEYGDVQGDQGIGWDWDIYAEGDESVNVGWDWNTYAGHNVNVGEGIEGDGYDDAGWDWNDMPGWDGEGSGGGSRGGGCGGAGLAGENELMGR